MDSLGACPLGNERTKSSSQDVPEYANSLFMRAARGESTERVPVWLMRQAGRYQEWYRELRREHSFINLCKSPALSGYITVKAVEDIGADAAIIFSDILLMLESFGIEVRYIEGLGPVLSPQIRTSADVRGLSKFDVSSMDYVYEAIRLARSSLPADIPLIGFSGAPFTVASYMLEGGSSRSLAITKRFMYSSPRAWRDLMLRLSDAILEYLLKQIDAGCQAVQLFDSWVGVLSRLDYHEYVLPYTKRVFEGLGDYPKIHYAKDSFSILSLISQTGANVMGLDYVTPLDEARNVLGSLPVQGNLDPSVLFAPDDYLTERIRMVLRCNAGRPGFIFNLGHGVMQQTSVDKVRFLISEVKRLSSK